MELFDNTVRLIDVATGKERARLQHQWSPKYISTARSQFSPDGPTLAVSDIKRGGTMVNVWLFNAGTGEELCHVYSGTKWSSSDDKEPLIKQGIAFSRNGDTRLLDVKTRRQMGAGRYAKPVTHLAFSPDSRFMITASMDGTAPMTETQSGTEIARFDHGEPITQAVFSRDVQSLLTSSDDKLRVWQADPEVPFKQLCKITRCKLTREEWSALFGESEPWRPISANGHSDESSETPRLEDNFPIPPGGN